MLALRRRNLINFPLFFIDDGIAKKKLKKNTAEMTPHCYQQNITLAFLMCRFYSSTLENQSSRFNAVLHYITQILNLNFGKNASEYGKPLVLALQALLLDNGLLLLQLNTTAAKTLLRSCIKVFLSNKFSEIGLSAKVLLLLSEIIQNSELYDAYGCEEFKDFLQFLPNLLLKETINESCLLAMGRLGKQQNAIFLAALKSILVKVVHNLQAIQVLGAVNVFEGKKHIINLFYWLEPQKNIKPEDLETLLKGVENISDKRITGYCQYVLTLA